MVLDIFVSASASYYLAISCDLLVVILQIEKLDKRNKTKVFCNLSQHLFKQTMSEYVSNLSVVKFQENFQLRYNLDLPI